VKKWKIFFGIPEELLLRGEKGGAPLFCAGIEKTSWRIKKEKNKKKSKWFVELQSKKKGRNPKQLGKKSNSDVGGKGGGAPSHLREGILLRRGGKGGSPRLGKKNSSTPVRGRGRARLNPLKGDRQAFFLKRGKEKARRKRRGREKEESGERGGKNLLVSECHGRKNLRGTSLTGKVRLVGGEGDCLLRGGKRALWSRCREKRKLDS